MNEFSQVQLRTFRTFLAFSLLVLVTSLSVMFSNSQKFRISEIEYVLDNQLEFQSINLLYGKSIWFVDENSFDQVYKDNPEVKNLSITKEIPNKLISFYGMALTTNDNFKKLLLAGIATWVGIQTILNLGGAVGLLPITGIVLPFISYGGTAMVSIFIGLSLAHNENLDNE